MAAPECDIAGFLRAMPARTERSPIKKPFLGFDENLNNCQITQLGRTLLRRDLIDCSSPLWYQTRVKDGVITGTFLGGVDKDSAFYKPNSLILDVGVPLPGRSWSDTRVVQMLVVNFPDYDKLIVLSADRNSNVGGLRQILREVVRPALAERGDRLSLTALYKKRKSTIADYCRGVVSFFEREAFEHGYRERYL
jgi:hypothetical protein